VPNYRRDNSSGATWFFTIVTYRRQSFLCDKRVRKALREAGRKLQTKYPFKINAWVLMPDHFHCIWTLPNHDSNFPLRIRLLKRYVTQACSHFLQCDHLSTPSRRKRKESSLWQRRYWEHRIRSESDLLHHMNYIHFNPVKHGLSHSPVEWPFSTIHQLIVEGVYTSSWATNPDSESIDDHDYGECGWVSCIDGYKAIGG